MGDETTSVCVNTFQHYECQCKSGFETSGNSTTCSDINECQTNIHNCDLQTSDCENTSGSYTCNCKPGHYYNQLEEKCLKNEIICPENSELANTDYFYVNDINDHQLQCICSPGYINVGDTNEVGGLICQDIDECELGSTAMDPCPLENEICSNLPGSFECRCEKGYKRSIESDQYSNCEPIIQCLPGFKYNSDKIICENINECQDPLLHKCRMSGTSETNNIKCIDEIGFQEWAPFGYTCQCSIGFELQFVEETGEYFCEDVDECAIPGLCREDEICVNNEGSFTCQAQSNNNNNNNIENIFTISSLADGSCPTGYKKHETSSNLCYDINECENSIYKNYRYSLFRACGFGYYCVNQPGSYYCTNDPNDVNVPKAETVKYVKGRRFHQWPNIRYFG